MVSIHNKQSTKHPIELRMRDLPGLTNGNKIYPAGASPDGLYTTYKGSATGTFTFGGWVKTNSIFGNFTFSRGNNANTTGTGISIILGGGPGGKFTVSNINATPNSGSTGIVTPSGQTALRSITTVALASSPKSTYFLQPILTCDCVILIFCFFL
jgi:hypothetical protein